MLVTSVIMPNQDIIDPTLEATFEMEYCPAASTLYRQNDNPERIAFGPYQLPTALWELYLYPCPHYHPLGTIAQSQPHNLELHHRCGSTPMSNGNPDRSGHACPGTFNKDALPSSPGVDDCRSISRIKEWFEDGNFGFDGASASCAAQADTFVDVPFGSDDIGLQSPPPSTLALDQPLCAEADFLEILYNCAAGDNVSGNTPYRQQSSGFPAFDNTLLNYLNGKSAPNQYAVTRTSPSSILSPKTRPDATQILETPVLKRHAPPKSVRAESQRTSYRCESRIVQAQFPFEQTTCGQTFAQSKDLKRHKSSVHREDDDPVYLCRCGKDDPRKDNHVRHVGVCVKSPCPRPYVCKCSHPSQGRDDHLEHVKSCSPGKRSRRRPNAS